MGKTALLFPGQASQYVGMGRTLHDGDDEARGMFERANEILGYDIARLCFEGPADELVQTVNTQPAIYVHSAIAYTLAARRGLTFDVAAGHSLGEYTALFAAGAFSFEDGLRAVKMRARFMQDACDAHPGTMAAILGLGFDEVQAACVDAAAAGVVVAANYNSPKQVAISGSREGIARACELAKERGAKRAIPLKVGGAFHSPLMEPTPRRLAEVLDGMAIADCRVPVVLNVTAEATTDGAAIKQRLIEQTIKPVLWAPSVDTMEGMGVATYIEVGPKKVLSGLVGGMVKGREQHSLDVLDDLAIVDGMYAGV